MIIYLWLCDHEENGDGVPLNKFSVLCVHATEAKGRTFQLLTGNSSKLLCSCCFTGKSYIVHLPVSKQTTPCVREDVRVHVLGKRPCEETMNRIFQRCGVYCCDGGEDNVR